MNTVCRTIKGVENALIKSGRFALPARPKAAGSDQTWSVMVVDVTEHPVERPKQEETPHAKEPSGRGQKEGHDPGCRLRQDRSRDFRLFKCSRLHERVRPDAELLGDSGFQGLAKHMYQQHFSMISRASHKTAFRLLAVRQQIRRKQLQVSAY